MSKIAVSVYDQTEVFTEIPDIFSGDVGTDTVEFTFDDSWNEYDERTVIFYNEPKKSYPVILDDTNIAVIPSEVIDRETKFYFGIVGTKANGEVKTSNVLSFRVEKGSLTADTELPYPSKDVWLQILANYEYALNKVNDIDVKVDNAITDTDTKLNTMDEKLAEMDQRFIESNIENKANKDLSNVTQEAIRSKYGSKPVTVTRTVIFEGNAHELSNLSNPLSDFDFIEIAYNMRFGGMQVVSITSVESMLSEISGEKGYYLAPFLLSNNTMYYGDSNATKFTNNTLIYTSNSNTIRVVGIKLSI